MKIWVWYVLDGVDFALVSFAPVGEEGCLDTFAPLTPADRLVRFAGALAVDW
jgi:hypothetical protein